jgi:hypothetical protein
MSIEAQAVAPVTSPVRSVTRSAALIIKVPPTVLESVPPSELDAQIEEPMDYSPIATLSMPDQPDEVWPDGTGPLGF